MRLIALVLFFILGCGSNSISSLNGLAANGGGKNTAILFGSPNGLGGVSTDIREMKTLLDQPDFHFRTVANGSASTSEIFETAKTEGKDADSLIFYFSGHGNRGVMLADDRTFTFNEVATALKANRNGRPFDRLLVVIDSCLSGSFVDGNGDAIITEPGSETGSHIVFTEEALYEPVAADANLYRQAFIFSASKQNENSQDLGSAKGGSFTYTFRTIMGELKESNPMVNFRTFAQKVSAKTEADYDHTPMWRGFPGPEVMNDYVFLYGAKN